MRAARARRRGVVKCIVGEVGGGWFVVGEIGLTVDGEREFLGAADRGVIYTQGWRSQVRQPKGLKHLHGSHGVLICVVVHECW